MDNVMKTISKLVKGVEPVVKTIMGEERCERGIRSKIKDTELYQHRFRTAEKGKRYQCRFCPKQSTEDRRGLPNILLMLPVPIEPQQPAATGVTS